MCNRRNFHNRNFECGQSVVVRDYRGNNKWTSGTIKQKTGPMSYRVETDLLFWAENEVVTTLFGLAIDCSVTEYSTATFGSMILSSDVLILNVDNP
jgi:hypothetical protein